MCQREKFFMTGSKITLVDLMLTVNTGKPIIHFDEGISGDMKIAIINSQGVVQEEWEMQPEKRDDIVEGLFDENTLARFLNQHVTQMW